MYLRKKLSVFAMTLCISGALPLAGSLAQAEEVEGIQINEVQNIEVNEEIPVQWQAMSEPFTVEQSSESELYELLDAENISISPRMTYLVSVSPSLSISSSGTATASVSAEGIPSVKRITVFLYLQRKTDSGSWLDVKRWDITEATDSLTVSKTQSVTTRGTYRVMAWVYGYVGTDDYYNDFFESTTKTY